MIGYWLLVLPILMLSTDLLAQYPGSSRNGGSSGGFGNFGNAGNSGGRSQTQRDPSRDTLAKEVYYYYADNAEEKTLFQDSSMINFHIYDPTRQAKYEYVNLGNLGSAHRQIVFQPRFRQGFDAGFHNYDLYLTKPSDIKYYQSEKAYSDIYFSQTSQEKTAFSANFSKPIGQNAALGVQYKNIRNTGQYNNQAARTNSFTGTYAYQSKNKKYRSYFSFTTNTVEQKENGGVVIGDSITLKKDLIAIGRPVNTSTGESRYFERDVNYTQFYLLQKTPKLSEPLPTKEDSLRELVTRPTNRSVIPIIDSVGIDTTIKNQPINPTIDTVNTTIKGTVLIPKVDTTSHITKDKAATPTSRKKSPISQRTRKKQQVPPTNATTIAPPPIPLTGRKYTLKHNLSLRRNTYKYVDASNLDYYGDFLLDDRGVRNFIETNQVANTFSIRTFKLEKENQNSTYGAKKTDELTQKDLIEVGFNHTFTKLEQAPIDSTINNLFLFGKIEFTPSERLKIKTYGHIGTLKQIGDYYIKGDFLWDTKKLGKIEFSLTNQLYTPSLLQRQFYVTSQKVWLNDFKKVFENSLSASYAIPKLKTDLTVNYHLINNYIYNNKNAQPEQLSSGLNIFQLIVNNQIDLGRFHLQNSVYFQQATASEDVIRFPEIYSIHRLYMDLKLFKVMESQFGGVVRFNTPYQPDNFQPLTGQFFLQDTEVPLYPIVDVFFNFRIQQFRFFIIGENLSHRTTSIFDFQYNTYSYPIPDLQVRFGFRWLFLD